MLLTACRGGKPEQTPPVGSADTPLEEGGNITVPATTVTPPPVTEAAPINIPPDGLTDEGLRLWNSIAECADGEIVFYDIDDYDGDGNLEMFAVVGRFREDEDFEYRTVYIGEFWTADNQGAGFFDFVQGGYFIDFLQLGMDKYFTAQIAQTNGFSCYIAGVRNGQWYEPSVSGCGMDLRYNENNELVYTQSAFDCAHTWNDYWLYYDEQARDFKEYGGVEITLEQLKTFKNYEIALGSIKEDEIHSILYRGNGIINVNRLIKYDSDYIVYTNITVRYTGIEITGVFYTNADGINDGRGKYLPALCSEAAFYPDITGLFE
jgi:hypothetical protein